MYLQVSTHVTLAAQPFEQVVRLELVLLVGHDPGHFERQPGLGHLVFEQSLAHRRVERRRHHVARAHRPKFIHHEHSSAKTVRRRCIVCNDIISPV